MQVVLKKRFFYFKDSTRDDLVCDQRFYLLCDLPCEVTTKSGVILSLRIKMVTWLILPVVICLSQRLSHACLSINKFLL